MKKFWKILIIVLLVLLVLVGVKPAGPVVPPAGLH